MVCLQSRNIFTFVEQFLYLLTLELTQFLNNISELTKYRCKEADGKKEREKRRWELLVYDLSIVICHGDKSSHM